MSLKLEQVEDCYFTDIALLQGAAEKKWTPKFFRRFLINRLGL